LPLSNPGTPSLDSVEYRPVRIRAAMALAGAIYENQGKKEEAEAIYREALGKDGLSQNDRFRIEVKLKALRSGEKAKQ
jgi:predicted negative regulator of RcsB-dependent stress response